MRRWLTALLACTLLVSISTGRDGSSPSIAYAGSFTVDDTSDLLDLDPNDGLCLASNGKCTLRAAIMQANASAGADVISLPAGNFLRTLGGSDENNATLGDLDITDAVTITGAGAGATIIDANNLDRVLDVQLSASLTLTGVTVRGGNASGDASNQGGGIRNGGSLTLNGVLVTANNAQNSGGGVSSTAGSSGSLTVTNSTISFNTAPFTGGISVGGGAATITASTISDHNSQSGSGLSVSGGSVTMTTSTVTRNIGGGGISSNSLLTITNSTIDDNRISSGLGGGGIRGHATLTNVTVSNNRSTARGGGVDGNFTITDSTFTGNQAPDGAGLWGTAIITNTNFTNNQATNQGGGLLLQTGKVTGGSIIGNSALDGAGLAFTFPAGGSGTCAATPSLNGVLVKNNIASRNGGGLFIFGNATAGFVNMNIEDNQAGQHGGGIYIENGGFTPTICGSTVSGNTAAQNGGGVWVRGSLNIQDSTVSGNTATSGVAGGIGFSPASPAKKLSLKGLTVNANTAAGGGNALFASASPLELVNTIISSGAGGNCAGVSVTSLGHNLSSDGACLLNAAGDLTNTNPLLGSLANNGGTTKTHALQSGSPAIDAGDNTRCSPADQRGEPRPRDGNGDGQLVCDIGAFEAPTASGPVVNCSPRPQVAVQTTAVAGGKLQAVISATSNAGPQNSLASITWGTMVNATVEIVGIGPASSGQQTLLTGGTQSVTILVSRVAPGQASTVPLTVTDGCGNWPTFVGGGANAF